MTSFILVFFLVATPINIEQQTDTPCIEMTDEELIDFIRNYEYISNEDTYDEFCGVYIEEENNSVVEVLY